MFPQQLHGIGIDQHLGARLPLTIPLVDASGKTVRLGDYFGRKPVLLIPMYYTCRTLCHAMLSGVIEGVSHIPLRVGSDFEIVAFSINPAETPADAEKKQLESERNYAGHTGSAGWHFLTGTQASVTTLTHVLGYRYHYDTQTHALSHPAGIMAITPDGRIARYFYGVTYQPKDLNAALGAASAGKIGSPAGGMLLLCYPYNPATGRYGNLVLGILRGAALLTLLLAGAAYIFLWRYDLAHYRNEPSQERPL